MMAGTPHPPEWQLGMYAEDALADAERREVDAHLVGCETCRRHVVALEDETRLLRSVLQGDATEVTTVRAPARGFTIGLPLAVALVAGLGSALSAALETRVPGATWLRPSRVLGVNEMLFDLIFALRDSAPGWLEFGVSIAALLCLGALGAFAAGALLRRVGGTAAIGLALIGMGFAAAPADAAVVLHVDESVHVPAGETIEGTLVVTGDTLVIEGTVAGDVVCFAERTSIRGRVEGNVFGGSRELEITGEVTGTVVFGSELSRITGAIGGSAYLGADHVTIGPDGRIAGNLTTGGERIAVEGRVGRDVVAFGEHLELRGEVARDLTFWGRDARLADGARVDGDVLAHVEAPERLEVAASARVGGQTETKLLEHPHEDPFAKFADPHFWFWTVILLAASLLVGLAIHALWPRLFDGEIASGRAFFVRLATGFAFLVIVPAALALAAITLVGIPLALIGAATYAMCLYVANIVVASLVGRSLLGPGDGSMRDFGLALVAGLAIVTVLRELPWVGGVAGFVLLLVGLGLLAGRAQALLRERRLVAG